MSNWTEVRRTAAPLGDALPPALTRYYRALDAGDIDGAVAAYTDDAVYAVPVAGPETQPRVVTRGRTALAQRLRRRGRQPHHHLVELCTVDGTDCLLEGVTVGSDGVTLSTFVAAATVVAEGIARYLAFACVGARDPLPTAVAPTVEPAVAADVVHRYFDELDGGNFAAAAACFAPDVLYSHPPYAHTGIDGDRRVEFHGRDELAAAFVARGRQSFGHRITTFIQRGPHALLEGSVFDLPDDGSGSFISSLSLDASGLIRRYVSFYCEPAVGG
jgi:ketosteroid isomerase-like protein